MPAGLTFQTDPEPHTPLTPEQQMDYRMQRSFRGASAETLSSYLLRLEFRVRYYRFFFLPALYLVLPLFLVSIRQWKLLWVALTLALFALGINFFPAYQLHYAAACTCLMILAAVTGLQKLAAVRREAARIVLFLCAAHFSSGTACTCSKTRPSRAPRCPSRLGMPSITRIPSGGST